MADPDGGGVGETVTEARAISVETRKLALAAREGMAEAAGDEVACNEGAGVTNAWTGVGARASDAGTYTQDGSDAKETW
ncbi:MAG: hypothetical protein R6X16_09620 [Anaerolineae bacterium]